MPRRLIETDPDSLAERVIAAVDGIHARTSVRELYENATGAAMLHDPDSGEMIHANGALCDFLGYDREELRSMPVSDLTADLPDYDQKRLGNIVTNVTDRDRSIEVEWPVATADDAVRWAELQLRSVRIGGRKVILSTWVDITDRRRQERKYEQVFDNVNDVISVHDPWSAELVDVNETMSELLGYSREALLGMDIDGFSVAEAGFTGERAYEIQRRVAATGEPETGEHRH